MSQWYKHCWYSFRCEYCDYNTTRNDLWKNHLRHQHPDKAVEKGIMTNDELVEMKIKLQTPGKRGRKPSKSIISPYMHA